MTKCPFQMKRQPPVSVCVPEAGVVVFAPTQENAGQPDKKLTLTLFWQHISLMYSLLKQSTSSPFLLWRAACRLLFAFLPLLLPGALRAQEKQILVEKFPVGERVGVMFQDSTGLAWFRTFGQITTQNGKKEQGPGRWFNSDGEKIFEVPGPPVPEHSRPFLSIDSKAPNGLMYLDGDSIRVFDPYSRRIVQAIGLDEKIDKKGETPLFYLVVRTSDNVIWAVLSKHGISDDNKLVPGSAVVVSRNGSSFKKVVSTSYTIRPQHFAVSGDQLFLSSPDTIRQYNIEGNLENVYPLQAFKSLPIADESRLQEGNTVRFFHFVKNDKTGGYDRAMYELAPGARAFTVHPYPELNGISFYTYKRTGDHYWLLGEPLSLHYFSPDDRKAIDYSTFILQQLPDLSYYHSYFITVFEDRNGTLWASTSNGDVLKVSSMVDPFTNYLSNKKAYDFCNNNTCSIRGMTGDDNGNMYFAYEFGIQKMDIATGRLTNLKLNLPENLRNVYSLSFYKQKLYLNALEIDPSTGRGKALMPNTSNRRITHYIDKDKGQMWIADGGNILHRNEPIQLYRYDFKTTTLSPIATFDDAPPNSINQVSQFHLSPTTRTLFMATIESGLYELNLDGTVMQRLYGAEPYSMLNMSLALYEDDYQQLWIGHQNGLSKLNLKTKEFTKVPYLITGSVPVPSVYSIQRQDKVFCWLGTSRGLYRLNVEAGELRSFQMFPVQSRIEFNRLSTFQDKIGRLYFGSLEGILAFDPEQLVREARLDERLPVQVALFSRYDTRKDQIVHTHEGLSSASTFHLYANHRYFSMEVFVADFRDAKKNTYTWWLENYESDWSNPSSSNTIRYDNLPPGDYILHVRGGILPENYELSERQFHIIVHQAWYKSWWAWCLYVILFFGIVYLIYRFNMNRQLEKQEAIRLHELDTLKTRLYTNITHEFRTPLTVIMGMTENISGHENERKLIRRNSKNLLRLINQLLDLSKLDSGAMKMDMVQGDIINYLQYLTESFHSMAQEKKLRLTFYSEITELVMDFDEAKIQHIIYNLLSNALKFTGEGGKVVLHANKTDRNGQSFLQLKVQDTGIGIPEDQLAHIFDRFYQADNSSTRKGEGTGIGLALTKELVELMQGHIAVESSPGKGTIFTLLLPIRLEANKPLPQTGFPSSRALAPELATELPAPPIAKAPDEQETFAGDKPVLLIIEDNADVVTYIVGLLEKEYDITTAPNGQAGLEKAFEIIPDIIISDVMMPEKDGYEVCEALKNDERTSHIPIILLTAKAETSDRITGLRKGADAYLMKPFNKEELYVRLEKLLELRRALQLRYAKMSDGATSNHPVTSGAEPNLESAFLNKLRLAVEEHLDDPDFDVPQLCRAAHLSNMQVNRKLKALTGKTPSRFIRSVRLYKAREMLQTTDLPVSEIAYATGFNDPNYFSRSYSEEFGESPSKARE